MTRPIDQPGQGPGGAHGRSAGGGTPAPAPTRPDPPFELDQRHERGLEWCAAVDEDWSTDTALVAGKRCRYFEGRRRCPKAAEAVLWRPVWRTDRPRRPWAYCGAEVAT